MPNNYDGRQVIKIEPSPYSQPQHSFTQDSFGMSEPGYASSVYSSSVIDPSSPGRQHNIGAMPTVFEEPAHPMADGFCSEILLQAAAGASDDFNSPHFMVGGPFGDMSPRTAMLHNLGEEVNASIVDTGVPSEEVDAYISNQDPVTKGVVMHAR